MYSVFTRFNLPGFDRNHVAGDKIEKNWQYCVFGATEMIMG